MLLRLNHRTDFDLISLRQKGDFRRVEIGLHRRFMEVSHCRRQNHESFY